MKMVDEERVMQEEGEGCGSPGGGYSIFLDKGTIGGFMEAGDFSSARELDHFSDVTAKLESRVEAGGGLSLLAISVTENRLPRDFSVLQIAHLLAKHGRSVAVVDCDFLHPGLSGLVERFDDLGFLDLLLYGSSVKSISHSIGIHDVGVIGPGSFPVSRALPFAMKEFDKARRHLERGRDVVIYCSTLTVGNGEINPLFGHVDGIVVSCHIEDMGEGELKRKLSSLGTEIPPVDLVCFCGRKEGAGASAAGREPVEDASGSVDDADIGAAPFEKPAISETIEKTEEIDTGGDGGRQRFSLPRTITIAAGVILVGFIIWWVVINRTIDQRESERRMTELVQKQRDAREAGDRTASERDGGGQGVNDRVTGERDAEGRGTADQVAGDHGASGEGAVGGEQAVRTSSEQGRDDGTSAGDQGTAERSTGGTQRGGQESGEGGGSDADGETSAEFYTVHVASFREMTRAEAEVSYLESKGFEPRIVEITVRGENWLRILIGEFGTREEAERLIAELRPYNRSEDSRVLKQRRK
jgi:hypothetical protein